MATIVKINNVNAGAISYLNSLQNTKFSSVDGQTFSKYVLDYFPAYSAFSFRKLKSTYAGNCFRVRRSSDNTEQDIGFSGDYVNTGSLTTFVGANSGYITKIYDQTGNGRDRTQTTVARQPLIVSAGTVQKSGSYVVANFNNVSYMLQHSSSASPMPSSFASSTYFVYKANAQTNLLLVAGVNQYAYVGNSGDAASAFGQFTNGSNYVNNVSQTISTRADDYTYLNTAKTIVHSAIGFTPSATWGNNWWFGGYNNVGGGFDWQGFYFEEINYYQSSSYSSSIAVNQGGYYGAF